MRSLFMRCAVLLSALALAGCMPTGGASSTSTIGSAPSSSGTWPNTSPSPGANGAGASVEPTDPVTNYKVTFEFGVPSTPVSVTHPVNPPPLRTLVGIYAANHPEGSPAYQRMSFYFQGGYPSYRVSYVASVLSEGQGTPIPLQGNAFLQVTFTDAQAHTDAGGPSVVAAPPASIGLQNLKSYGSAGDFEGHVTYGLGLQVAPNSGQVLPIRVGELTRTESGGPVYVVFVDIKTG